MFDLISAIGELITSWRFYLCVIPAVALAVGVGACLDNQILAWLIAVPSVLLGIVGGFYWNGRQVESHIP